MYNITTIPSKSQGGFWNIANTNWSYWTTDGWSDPHDDSSAISYRNPYEASLEIERIYEETQGESKRQFVIPLLVKMYGGDDISTEELTTWIQENLRVYLENKPETGYGPKSSKVMTSIFTHQTSEI